MTLPIQIAAIGAGILFAFYLIFKDRNRPQAITYDRSPECFDTFSYKPPSYDTHPRQSENGSKSDECVICCEPFEEDYNVPIMTLRCSHKFHEACIKRWLREERVCPICRKYA